MGVLPLWQGGAGVSAQDAEKDKQAVGHQDHHQNTRDASVDQRSPGFVVSHDEGSFLMVFRCVVTEI